MAFFSAQDHYTRKILKATPILTKQNQLFLQSIGRMIDTVRDWHFTQFKRIQAFKTGDVKANLIRVGATYIVSVNPTYGTKKVFCCTGVKLVNAEPLVPTEQPKTFLRCRRHDGTSTTTK
ncbi:hypothetical protein AZI86_12840 [Bdellovibrio bacteriovorus]|uniref:Uncharacterized protein n=1 Tax=Bdellovibrio bacteriovorus TaxID=959 RepID=A0A150WJ34_BDEBC|nr:hypothetical protein AZI86_12840 [Bdellovibrio bacteriovorus]